jgi:hypothetical protein
VKATLQFQRKVTLIHARSTEVAVAELKVWNVPHSAHYPEGLKYSLFLVAKQSGRVIVGFDNHKPKGPHLHHEGKELLYAFSNVDTLVEDFWNWVKKEGFTL